MTDSEKIIAVMLEHSKKTTKKLPRNRVLEAAMRMGVAKGAFYSACATLEARGAIGYTHAHAAASRAKYQWLTESGIAGATERIEKTNDSSKWSPPEWARWNIARPDGDEHLQHPSRRGDQLVHHMAGIKIF
jgi:hypothetical protein